MRNELALIEQPIKSALSALAAFVVSALVLRYLYEVLASTAFSLAGTGVVWDEISAIGGLTIDRGTRYLIFYFFIFLTYATLLRSTLNSSVWSALLKFAVLPTILSITPHLFSGEFVASPQWAALAVLIALISIKTNAPKHPTALRLLFFTILLSVLVSRIVSDATQWGNAMNKIAIELYGERSASQRTWSSFAYFAPGAVFRVAVDIYLVYFLPKAFFQHLNKQITKESDANLLHTTG